jgi:hypothetical protein
VPVRTIDIIAEHHVNTITMSAEPSPLHDVTQDVIVMYNVPSYALCMSGLPKVSRMVYYSLQISDLREGEGTWLCHYVN